MQFIADSLGVILGWLLEALRWVWGKVTQGVTWLWTTIVLAVMGFIHAVVDKVLSWAHEITQYLQNTVWPHRPDLTPLNALGDVINTLFPLNETILMLTIIAGVLIACTTLKVIRLIIRLCWGGAAS